MALNSFYNAVAAGLIGGLFAHTLPESIDSYRTAFNEALAEQHRKPYANSMPLKDGAGTFTLYAMDGNAMSFGVYRNAEGKIDREGEPAVTVFTNDSETVVGEGWYKNGKLHREDGPALVGLNPATGKRVCEEWYLNGERMVPWRNASFGAKPSSQPSPCELYVRNPKAQPF